MKESVVILSIAQSESNKDKWDVAALRIEEGILPKYYIISAPEILVSEYRIELKEFIGPADIFVFEDKDLPLNISEKLGINYKEISNVKEIAMILYPLAGRYELEEFAESIGVKIKNKKTSSASRTVRLACEVLKKCFDKVLLSDLSFVTGIIECTEGLKCNNFFRKVGSLIIKRYPDRPIRTGFSPKRYVSENMFNKASGNSQEDVPRDPEWAGNFFEAGGILSSSFPSYEYRSIQTQMARTLIRGFTESTDIIIEAGTGTGKTLAYLISSLWWAKVHNQRVMIATHTITLQEQIFFKDLPALAGILPYSFKTALLKGRNNYICLKSFKEQKIRIHHMSPRERLERSIILSWIQESVTGDFGELTYADSHMLGKIYGSNNRMCQPGDCSYRQSCFYLGARKKAEEADLVVVNHSLLLADIKTKNRVLPEYHNLIIDEAHNFYPTALKQLGFELCLEQIVRLMDSFAGNEKSGFLGSLKRFCTIWIEAYPQAKISYLENILDEIPSCSLSILEQAKELFGTIEYVLEGRTNLLIEDESIKRDILEYIFLSIENLQNRLILLTNALDKISSSMITESEQGELIRYDVKRYKSELGMIIEGLRDITAEKGECRITYLERTNTTYIKSCPFDIAPILREEIFSKNNCTALVSATLSVAGNFEYVANDLGIEDYLSLKLDSTFNYDEQMLFCVVNDLSAMLSEKDLICDTTAFIRNIVEVMRGRTLVLFTSHRVLRLVHNELQKVWPSRDYLVLSQGINGNRDKILKEFMQREKCVLMGTNSFWEGIDVPGDNLRCVVMVKLPFSSPDAPIIKAKSSLLKEQGGDPFNELLLPEAVIRFKQGFGRLIRTKDDQGVVVLLDDRIIKKSYGKYFLKSLPISSYYKGDAGMVINQVSKWI